MEKELFVKLTPTTGGKRLGIVLRTAKNLQRRKVGHEGLLSSKVLLRDTTWQENGWKNNAKMTKNTKPLIIFKKVSQRVGFFVFFLFHLMDPRLAPLEDVKIIVDRIFFSGPYKRISLHEDAVGLFVLLTLFQETGEQKYLDRVRSSNSTEWLLFLSFLFFFFLFLFRFISLFMRALLLKLNATFGSRGFASGTMPFGKLVR